LTAAGHAREAAQARRQLSFDLLMRWQTEVLGVPNVGFRTAPAYAKAGRERYGRRLDTQQRFIDCLAQATDPAVPVSARAARVYLDVAFFHLSRRQRASGDTRALLCTHA
jgi:hypothetical protein